MTKKLLLISISILLALLSACGGGGECGITPTTAAADQSIVGTANNDVLNSTQGNDTIDGLEGLNTVVYQCGRSNYTITKTTNGWTVTSAAEGADTLANIQRLQFTDEIVALDVDGNAGMAYRIYQAAFNRTPDNEGLKFWIAQLDNGASYQSVAAGFISSAEFQSLYGKNPSNGDFITKLYSNVLHRAPDPAGYAWWLNVLNTNQITQVGALMGFSESAENKSGVSAAIGTGVSLLPIVQTKPISGTAYIRDSNISFASNASGVGISNTTVAIVGVSSLTGSDGNFTINAPLTFLATDKMTLTNANYIPISIDRSLVDINPPYTNIGMYPVQSVQKKTGFITGIFTMDGGGFMPDVFSNNKFAPTYDRIISSTSANLVAISDPAWVTRSDTLNNVVTMSATDSIPMYTGAQYTHMVNLAKARNLKFLMQIGVYPSNGVSLPWGAQSKSFWDAWFGAYKPLVLKQTAIATALGIEYISLGMNHGFMSSVDVGYWQDLISAVRAAGYQGKLVYQAHVSFVSGAYNEASAFNAYSLNASLTMQQKNYAFAQLFDYIVLNIYGVASQVNGKNYVSRDTIKSNMQSLLAGLNNYPVPLMVMIGTPSVQDGATTSDYIEPCLQCSSVANNHTVDLFAQADVYQAVLEAINDGSVANGHVAGILSWGYWYSDNYGLEDASVPDVNSDGALINYLGTIHAGAYNKSSSIRGKPAESILKWWANNLK